LNKKYVVSAECFALQHPLLFGHYKELMAATLARIAAKREELTKKFDGEVSLVLRAYSDAQTACNQAYMQVAAPALEQLRTEGRNINAELNANLQQLLREKDEADNLVDGGKQAAALDSLQGQWQAAHACYRELNLHEEIAALQAHFDQAYQACMESFATLRAPAQARYRQDVAAAYLRCNNRLAQAQSAYAATIDTPSLTLKRGLRDADAVKQSALQSIAWRRDDATSELQSWVTAVKHERLQCIESFLSDPCEFTLQEELKALIADMQ